MVFSSRSIKMSPLFVLGRENVPWVAEVVNRSLKADCTDFNTVMNKFQVVLVVWICSLQTWLCCRHGSVSS